MLKNVMLPVAGLGGRPPKSISDERYSRIIKDMNDKRLWVKEIKIKNIYN